MAVNENPTLAAQTALIGSLLIDPDIAGEFFQIVRESDFTMTAYRNVYLTAKEIFSSGARLDAVAVAHRLGKDHEKWLAEVMQITPTSAGWKEYAALARESAGCILVNEKAAQLSEARTLTDKQKLYAEMGELFLGRESKDESLKAAAYSWMDMMNSKREYVKFGMTPLDGNIRAPLGAFVLLGARPSVGKTAMALQWATKMALKYRVGIFSLETSREQLMDRIYCRVAHIPFSKIQDGNLREAEWQVVAQQSRNMAKHLQMDIIEASGYTVEQITTRALAGRHQIIIIDYLQLIAGSEPKAYDRVSNISMKLHTFAQRTKTMVIGLCQLRRTDQEPRMSDLRESGQLEQDADVIMLLHQTDEDDKASPRKLKIEKNKTGECFQSLYSFRGVYQEFEYIPPKSHTSGKEQKNVRNFRETNDTERRPAAGNRTTDDGHGKETSGVGGNDQMRFGE